MRTPTRRRLPGALALLLASALPLGGALAQGDLPMTEGTVRKVDAEQGKVTIKHGPIANLEMPPMTMVFGMKDPAGLDGLERGDEVRFTVVEEGGKMLIERIESAR